VSASHGVIAVCLATYEPDPALLQAQVASLRSQTDTDWVCVVSDDASSAAGWAAVEAAVDGDPRFRLSRSHERLGFYRNFERALRLAPAEAPLLALCDQDDRWHADKLATLRGALGGAGLVYSDQRLVDSGGRVLRETLWQGRRNDHTDLAAMLVANTVTGASALLRREVVDLALPFPQLEGLQFHDHWLAVVALAAGDVAYVDRPLYDYVQHAGAVFGDVSTGTAPRRLRRLPDAQAAYVYGYRSRVAIAQALLERCGERLTADKRRALERFVAAERSPAALAWLAARGAASLVTSGSTLGSELGLVRGVLWHWASATPLVRHPGPPDATAFEQRRLRRWRARL
jgi:glycosyltransferase involved in cell wall biosynthesis